MEFLQQCPANTRVTFDQWSSFLEFSNTVKDGFQGYDEEGACESCRRRRRRRYLPAYSRFVGSVICAAKKGPAVRVYELRSSSVSYRASFGAPSSGALYTGRASSFLDALGVDVAQPLSSRGKHKLRFWKSMRHPFRISRIAPSTPMRISRWWPHEWCKEHVRTYIYGRQVDNCYFRVVCSKTAVV